MSPFDSGEAGRRVSKRLSIPWVADLRDPWALDEMQIYPTLLHRAAERMRMERLLSTASLIIMNTPEAAAAVKSEFPSLRHKPVICIPNGFDSKDFISPAIPRAAGRFQVVHSGYLHTEDGLRLRSRSLYRFLRGAEPGVDILTRSHAVLLEAVERWISQRPEVAHFVELVFAGKASSADRDLARRSGVASLVRFIDYVQHDESLDLIKGADVLFLPMQNLPPGKRSRIVPGKTYEYMATGRPILAAVPDGDARDFLERCGTALLCRPDDAAGMAAHLDRVYSAWKEGRTLVRSNTEFVTQFDRVTLTHVLADHLRGILQDGIPAVARGCYPSAAAL